MVPLLGGVDHLLLGVSELAKTVDVLNTVNTQSDLGREELDPLVLEQRRVDKGRLNNVFLAGKTVQHGRGKSSTGLGHRQGSRTSTTLGLDDFVTTELDSVDQSVVGLLWQVLVVGLGDQRNNGDSGVAANNGDVLVDRVGSSDFRQESRGSQHVQGGDTKQLLWVVDVLGLEHLGDNRNGRVDRVRDHTDGSVWTVVGTCLSKVSDNRGVGVEQVVSGHARFSRNTGWDQNDIGAF
ncbi:hypothetical protein OGATHE_003962 [Ogataea polymorpha]|uniref:Uncharacterized protein n=1 Tax=Ogataea polymorpha TaxID=460523 RepID=A0A9P8P4N6_9ASCO|nr:hypothetical protein OGATHE_003962 [Ogataea polymorpha]